jgi:hypothetical protein
MSELTQITQSTGSFLKGLYLLNKMRKLFIISTFSFPVKLSIFKNNLSALCKNSEYSIIQPQNARKKAPPCLPPTTPGREISLTPANRKALAQSNALLRKFSVVVNSIQTPSLEVNPAWQKPNRMFLSYIIFWMDASTESILF